METTRRKFISTLAYTGAAMATGTTAALATSDKIRSYTDAYIYEGGGEVYGIPKETFYYMQKKADSYIFGLAKPMRNLHRKQFEFLRNLALKTGERIGQQPCLHLTDDVAISLLYYEVPPRKKPQADLCDEVYECLFPDSECTMTLYDRPYDKLKETSDLFAFTLGVPLGSVIQDHFDVSDPDIVGIWE